MTNLIYVFVVSLLLRCQADKGMEYMSNIPAKLIVGDTLPVNKIIKFDTSKVVMMLSTVKNNSVLRTRLGYIVTTYDFSAAIVSGYLDSTKQPIIIPYIVWGYTKYDW